MQLSLFLPISKTCLMVRLSIFHILFVYECFITFMYHFQLWNLTKSKKNWDWPALEIVIGMFSHHVPRLGMVFMKVLLGSQVIINYEPLSNGLHGQLAFCQKVMILIFIFILHFRLWILIFIIISGWQYVLVWWTDWTSWLIFQKVN